MTGQLLRKTSTNADMLFEQIKFDRLLDRYKSYLVINQTKHSYQELTIFLLTMRVDEASRGNNEQNSIHALITRIELTLH